VWLPSVSGNYLLKADWMGNADYNATTIIVNFVILPLMQQSFFSLESNSTISAIAFNSTSKELDFSVSGPVGTTGYINVHIPKSLINNASNLKVLIDGNQTAYSCNESGDTWLLIFTYHHSTHNVSINFKSSSSTVNVTLLQVVEGIALGLTISFAIIVLLFVLIRKKHHRFQKRPPVHSGSHGAKVAQFL
jgi:hypothetical protein